MLRTPGLDNVSPWSLAWLLRPRVLPICDGRPFSGSWTLQPTAWPVAGEPRSAVCLIVLVLPDWGGTNGNMIDHSHGSMCFTAPVM